VNTDDPASLSTTLEDEIALAAEAYGWDDDVVVAVVRTGIEASFAPEALRQTLLGALAATGAPAVACSQCGIQAAGGPPLDWVVEYDARRGRTYVCQACARRHLRSIEGKLDATWW